MKYECFYLHAFETGSEAKAGIGNWVSLYNEHRPHSSLDDLKFTAKLSKTWGPLCRPAWH
ncbi:MAG: transposase [Deltaproteobacteria bacterium]|nr:transposase [Deltaproteobacteria bacterium]